MGHARKLFQIHGGIYLDVAQWIEVFHRQVQLLGEKLRGVGHDACAAGEEQSLRSRPALLSTIKLDGLVDLDVQLGHELPSDLGDGGLVRVLGFLIRAAQADKAFGNLDLFGVVEFQLGFVGEVLGDGVGSQVDAAGKDFAFLEKEQVAGLGADVQKHGAVFQIAIIIAEGVAEGGDGGIAEVQLEFGLGGHAE